MKAAEQLMRVQWVFFGLAGAFVGWGVFGPPDYMANYLSLSEVTLLAIGALIAAVAYYGAVIAHELYEVNDQLAGRSPEFHNFIERVGAGAGKGRN